jgi:hypothetical protein
MKEIDSEHPLYFIEKFSLAFHSFFSTKKEEEGTKHVHQWPHI